MSHENETCCQEKISPKDFRHVDVLSLIKTAVLKSPSGTADRFISPLVLPIPVILYIKFLNIFGSTSGISLLFSRLVCRVKSK